MPEPQKPERKDASVKIDPGLLYGIWACLQGADSVTSEIASRHASLLSEDVVRDLKGVSADCRQALPALEFALEGTPYEIRTTKGRSR